MTTTSAEGQLPQISESQIIGQLGEICLYANRPPIAWQVTPLGGVNDFGFDYMIQLVVDRQVKYVFKAQLKGTTTPELNATGEFFSVQLNASTVRYYSNTSEPVLLLLADLSVDQDDPSACPMYYQWVHEDLKRFNSEHKDGLSPEQTYVNLRVPKKNRLQKNTDLTAEVIQQLKVAKVGEIFDDVVETHHPDFDSQERIELIGNLAKGFSARNTSFLDTVADEPVSAWPQPPSGSIAWHLAEATTLLKAGRIEEVETALTRAKSLDGPTALETAEIHFLDARIYAFREDEDKALVSYEKAIQVAPNVPKYLATWAEMSLRINFDIDGKNDFSDLIEKLVGDDPSVVGMRARLLGAEGRYDEAIEVCNTLEEKSRWGVLSMIQIMDSRFLDTILTADQGLKDPNIRDTDKQLLLLMRARAKFYLATGWPVHHVPDTPFPISGTNYTNIELLHEAWENTLEITELFKSAGWPPDSSFITDLLASIAGVLNKQPEALSYLVQMSKARPTSKEINSALELIAMQCEEFSIALNANEKLPEDSGTIFRRLHLLNLSKNDSACVALLKSKLDILDRNAPMFGATLSLGALSADKIFQQDAVKTWEEILATTANLAEEFAVYTYLKNVRKKLWTRIQAADFLEENYDRLGKPIFIGIHLFHELDSLNPTHAHKIIGVASDLEKKRKLSLDSMIHLTQAHATVGQWAELYELTKKLLIQFENHEMFRGVEALALDRLGRSAEALTSLKKMIDSGISDPFVINIYFRIVARSGFTEEAIRSLETLLSQEQRKEQRLQCLFLFLDLIQSSNPEDSRCLNIIYEIGDLVDQSKQDEEGMFLGKYIQVTLLCKEGKDNERSRQIAKRIENFGQNFPNSKIFRAFKMPEDSGPNGLMKLIKEVLGNHDEQQEFVKKSENLLRTGAVPFPFSFRPKAILQHIRDVATLWEVGKKSKFHERQYHLTLATQNDTQIISPSVVDGRIPILDLLTLMVIQDLDLFDGLFKVFPRIAIGQATFNELNDLIRPVSGSPYAKRCIALRERLKASFDNIDQPSVAIAEVEDFLKDRWSSGEIKSLVETGRYMLYSDDAVFRLFCEVPAEHGPTFCTLDLLGILETQENLKIEEIAEKVSKLCSWNVRLVMPNRYLIAVIPQEFQEAHSVKQGMEMLQKSSAFMDMFNSIWDPSKTYKELLADMGLLAHELFMDPKYGSIHLAAFIAIWHSKIILKSDVQHNQTQVAIMAILQIAFYEPAFDYIVSQKMINAFGDLIQLINGERMDDEIAVQAIQELAKGAAQEDFARNLDGKNSFRQRLGNGFVTGTAPSEQFFTAYAAESALIKG